LSTARFRTGLSQFWPRRFDKSGQTAGLLRTRHELQPFWGRHPRLLKRGANDLDLRVDRQVELVKLRAESFEQHDAPGRFVPQDLDIAASVRGKQCA
jgi:hypothetical protein